MKAISHLGLSLPTFNPDFAVEIVMKVSNAIQIGISGYFLAEEIVNYFDVKKCSEILSCSSEASEEAAIDFQLQNPGLK